MVGGSLVTMPNDDAEARLQEGARSLVAQQRARCGARPLAIALILACSCAADTGVASADVERLSGELADIKAQMARLKTVLYGKFGDSINLEE